MFKNELEIINIKNTELVFKIRKKVWVNPKP